MSEPTRPEFHWPAAPAFSTAGEGDAATAEPIQVEALDQSHAESEEADDDGE